MRELDRDYIVGVWSQFFEEDRMVSFSRWGDGEFACILGYGPTNCDRHPYTTELATELRLAFTNPLKGVVYGIQPAMVNNPGLLPLLTQRGINEGSTSDYSLVPADALHWMSMAGKIQIIYDYLVRSGAVLVGPAHLTALHLPMIHVPQLNCFSQSHAVEDAMRGAYEGGARVFALSCSMMAEVLIHHLQPEMPDALLVDFGSIWDPYCGRFSRTYHKRRTEQEWKELLTCR